MNPVLINVAVVAVYIATMVLIGVWGYRKSKGSADFLLAGRSLGPVLYCSAMGALVIGGGSTVGGVGLGYQHGLSGMWTVVAIGLGVAAVSFLVARTIWSLQIYTISEMLALRYGMKHTGWSGIIIVAQVFFVSVASTVAYSTVFHALFGMGHLSSTLMGGVVMVGYCVLGGMWSISMNDFVQCALKTVAIFFILLPAALWTTRGLKGAQEKFDGQAFNPFAVGWQQILTYFVLYTVGALVSQDLWQRAATARSVKVARWAGAVSALYCVAYGVAVALIGAGGALIVGTINPSFVYGQLATVLLPPVLSALVLTGAMAAMMSTASGSLLAAATVMRRDVVPMVRNSRNTQDHGEKSVHLDRKYVIIFGVANVLVACFVDNVLAMLSIGYSLVVGALIVPVFGGLLWKGATGKGALAAMGAGSAGAIFELIRTGDPEAITPVYCGLLCSALMFVAVSLATDPTPREVRERWDFLLSRRGSDDTDQGSAKALVTAERVGDT